MTATVPTRSAPAWFDVDAARVRRFAELLEVPPEPVPVLFAVRALPDEVGRVLSGLRPPPSLPAIRHARQQVHRHRPMRVGERLSVRSVLRAVGDLGFQHAAVVDTRLCDGTGAPVVDLETTLTVGPARGSGRLGVPPETTAREAVLSWRIGTDPDLPHRYAAASGDRNPIHLDPAAARAAGLPGVVLHGMSLLHLVVRGVADRMLDGDETRILRVQTRFARPVPPGAVLDVVVHDSPDAGVLLVRASVDGAPVLKNTRFEVAS